MKKADVSVVIPVYNNERYLAETLQSVLDQTLQPVEIIVVDDGSCDGSLAIGRTFENHHPSLRVISQTNAGICAARNRGARDASGSWLAFLDADDRWRPDKLETQMKALDHHPGVVVIGGPMQYLGVKGPLNAYLGESDIADRQAEIASAMLLPFQISAALVHAETFVLLGGFDKQMKPPGPAWAEDLDLFSRLVRHGTALAIPNILGLYRLHSESLSNRRYFAQRMTGRFIRDRINAERAGSTISWEEFRETSLTFRQRWHDCKAYFFRQAGVRWAMGQRLRSILCGTAAGIMGPRYATSRLLSKCFRRGATGSSRIH